MTASIIGPTARIAVLRAKLRYWKQERALAYKEHCASEAYARACDEQIAYFRKALQEESQ